MYQRKTADVESDYAEVTDKESHPNQPSVAQATSNVAPLERDFAVVKKKSTDEPPAVGEVDGMPQARMPPAKPSPYKGTAIWLLQLYNGACNHHSHTIIH